MVFGAVFDVVLLLGASVCGDDVSGSSTVSSATADNVRESGSDNAKNDKKTNLNFMGLLILSL